MIDSRDRVTAVAVLAERWHGTLQAGSVAGYSRDDAVITRFFTDLIECDAAAVIP